MKRAQRQLPINWNATTTPTIPQTGQNDETSGDPLVDVVNELFAIQTFLEGDDFAQEYILKDMQELKGRWFRYLQRRMAEALAQGDTQDGRE